MRAAVPDHRFAASGMTNAVRYPLEEQRFRPTLGGRAAALLRRRQFAIAIGLRLGRRRTNQRRAVIGAARLQRLVLGQQRLVA